MKKLGTYWNKPPEGRYLPYKEWVSYSAGGMGVNFVINLTYIFISAEFIPQMYGIGAVHGRWIANLVILLNLVVQPLFGKLLDNTHTKHGKFKPFLVFMTPIVGIITIMAAWTPQFASETARIVYAYATCTPTLLLSALWLSIYNMVPSVLTPNSQERTDLLAPVGLISSFAPTLLNVIVGPIRNHYIQIGKEYMAFRILGLICGIFGMLVTYLIVIYNKERVYVTPEQTLKIKFWDGIKQVLKNKPFMVFQLANVFGVLKLYINAQMIYISQYKYADVYGEGYQIMSMLSLITGFGATPAMLIAPFLARKFNKRDIMIASQLLCIVPSTIALIIGFQNLPIGLPSIILMTISGFMISFNAGITLVISPAITAEQYDYQQYKTGNRLEGFMGAVTAWTAGLGSIFFNTAITKVQTNMGFEPGSVAFKSNLAYTAQYSAISNRWFNTVALLSLITSLIWCAILLWGYKLSTKEHARIMEDIKARSIANTLDNEEAFEILENPLDTPIETPEEAKRRMEELEKGIEK